MLPRPVSENSVTPMGSTQTPEPRKISSGAPPPKSKKKLMVVALTLLSFIVAIVGGIVWYTSALGPVSDADDSTTRVVIKQGQGVSEIATTLKSKKLIRSALAFRIHGELSGLKSSLNAGGYIISPSESIPEIMEHMSAGNVDEFDVTLIPGQSLLEIGDSLEEQGFDRQNIDKALNKAYAHPLFKDKPAGTGLEGYIYPDTYRIAADGSVEDVLKKSFDEFERILQEGNYDSKFKKQKLTRYEAFTLSSIISLEVTSLSDQRQVAQVFKKRLADDMMLGSDPTFKYAGEKDGVENPGIDYDSPYNTRLYKGLPPGPIGNFTEQVLKAVTNPAKGKFLYFVAGDDGMTYFSKTLDGHEANVARYCTTECQ